MDSHGRTAPPVTRKRDCDRFKGMTRVEISRVRRDPTDPRHLFDWAQFHVAPRLYRNDPVTLVTTLNPRRSVADALFPRARQALLVLFFQFPGHWFRQTDIVEATGLGLGGTQRELKSLRLAELVRARPVRIERRRQFPSLEFSANPESPSYAALHELACSMLHTPFAGSLRLPPDPDYLENGQLAPLHLRARRQPSA